jgi:predicted AAA+ superfamily ATPase
MVLNSSPDLVARRAEQAVGTALTDTRVVLVVGPRQAGKTTLVRKFANDQRPFLSLDDPVTLANAKSDPVGFIRNLNGAVIDEIQRAPELMLVIKQSVDANTTPGRFLLTGSANVMALPTIGDSLAGRIEIIELLPFAQAELLGRKGNAIDLFFSNKPLKIADAVVGHELAGLVARGGYPEAVARKDDRRRAKWFNDYVALILDRDVRDISTIDQLEKLPQLVRLLAEQSGQLSNHTNIASALQISRATVGRYLETLERLFLIDTLPPWFSNRISRLIKTPKHHFLDSGLLAALRQFSPAPPQADPDRFGPLLESFVGAELRKLIGWSDHRVTLSHFRTKEGDEVDFVLEDQHGRVVGIEVKASATLRRGDFSGLRKLEAAAGDKFVRGLVLHDYDSLRPVSERISGVPVSVLWSA